MRKLSAIFLAAALLAGCSNKTDPSHGPTLKLQFGSGTYQNMITGIEGLDRFRFIPLNVGMRPSDKKFFLLWNERWRARQGDNSHLQLATGPQDSLIKQQAELSLDDNRTMLIDGGTDEAEAIYIPDSGFSPIWGRPVRRISPAPNDLIPPGAKVLTYGTLGEKYILAYKIQTGEHVWDFKPTVAIGHDPLDLKVLKLFEMGPEGLVTTFFGGSVILIKTERGTLIITPGIAILGEDCDTFTIDPALDDDPLKRY